MLLLLQNAILCRRVFKVMNRNLVYVPVCICVAGVVLLQVSNTGISCRIAGICWLINILFFLYVFWCFEKSVLKNTEKERVHILHSMLADVPDLLSYKDRDGVYVDCNSSFAKIHGFSSCKDIIGKTACDLYERDVFEEIKKIDKKVINSGTPVKYLKSSRKGAEDIAIHEVMKVPVKFNGRVTGIVCIARDVTDRQKLQEYLILKQAQLSSFLNNTSLYICMLDQNGKILLGNDRFSNLIGEKNGDYVGKKLNETALKDFAEDITANLYNVIVEKQVNSNKVFVNVNGRKMWLKIVKSPVFDKNEDVIGAACVMRNIDEEIQLKIQRDTFFASLSHDLKTPLIANIRALELILKNHFGYLNDKQRDILEQALISNRQLYNMLTNLLSSYKNEEGLLNLQYSKLHASALVRSVCKELFLLAKDRNLKLEIKTMPENDEIVVDEQEIRRVVVNLLSNAISYADIGSTVSISMYNSGNDFTMEVLNKSRYIPIEKLSKLFDKYVSVSNKLQKMGTGLGLYSSKLIISAHNGYMLAKSTKNEMTRFGFIVPLTPEKQVASNRAEIIKNH